MSVDVNGMANRILTLFNQISTTNVRVIVTVALSCFVVLHSVYTGKAVDNNTYLFLAAMAGLDVAQYSAKRWTHIPGGASDDAPTDSSTDNTTTPAAPINSNTKDD